MSKERLYIFDTTLRDGAQTQGVDFSAGSLGMGLSFGLGCALAARMDSSDRDIWVMVGDGETQEGQFWEAAMAADFHSVGRLNLIVDRNRIQNDDFVEVQMEVGDVAKKLSSFGWDVKEIDGHSMEEVVSAIEWSSSNIRSPTAIVAHTTKGKGVSFMENNPSFHGKAPTDEELRMSLEELSCVPPPLVAHPEMGMVRLYSDCLLYTSPSPRD